MLNKLHIEESQVPKMCVDLYKEHGTTMAGLKVVSEYFFLGELFLNTDTRRFASIGLDPSFICDLQFPLSCGRFRAMISTTMTSTLAFMGGCRMRS